MKLKLGRSIHTYYLVILGAMLIAMVGGGYFFWSEGALNKDNVASIYEAGLQYDKLKDQKNISEIEKMVSSDRVRDAVQKLDRMKESIKELHLVQEVDQYEDLSFSMVEISKSLGALLAYPELGSIVLILNNKIRNFESFVSRNNWRTLTRMSQAIKARVAPSKIKVPGFFNYRRLNRLQKSMNADIDKMRIVTTNSILANSDKALIIAKLKTFDTELKMITNYIRDLNSFNTDIKRLSKRYDNWLEKIGPEISLKRMEVDKTSQMLVFSLLGMVGFLLLAMFGGYWLQTKVRKASENEVEDFVLEVIKDGLVPFESKMKGDFSNKFQDEFERLKRYFHKRISFGSVFQEALPFAGILLDSNLNLLWGNDIFYSSWNIGDRNRDNSISWDYLQRFTNLGEDDPLMLALNDGVAGIYQIQVKREKESKAMPYEMYVSPVDYAGQKRIMILFYPLNNLEDTLSHQNKSLVGPVARTLDALTQNSFNGEFKEKIAKDFDIAGINNIYEKFNMYFEQVTSHRHGLMKEINRLEGELYDQYKMMDDLREIMEQFMKVQELTLESFNVTKSSIVANIDLRYVVENQVQDIIAKFKQVLNQEGDLIAASKKVNLVLDENIQAFETVAQVRDKFKTIRGHVDEFRSRLVQTVDQSMVLVKREGEDPATEQHLGRIKMEVRGFDQTLSEFGGIVRMLDVALSKVELILKETKAPNFDHLSEEMAQSQNYIKDQDYEIGRLVRTGEVGDEELICHLKSLFSSFKESKLHLDNMFDLAEGSEPTIEVTLEPEEISPESPQPQA